MSFIKIKDPRKREELIKDFIETRKRIKDNFIARKVGEAEYQTGLTKLFKPVTETQKTTAKEITEAQKATAERIEKGLLPIKEGLENLTMLPIEEGEKKTITLTESLTEEEKTNLGPIAETFLKTPWNKENLDLDFGLNTQNEERKFKIGDKFVKFEGDNIKVDGEKEAINGTVGLWSLITAKNPDPNYYTPNDIKKYKDLLIKTNAIFKNNDTTETRPKGNYKGDKWKEIIKPIWEEIKPKPKGKGKGRKKRQDDPQPGPSGTDPQTETPGGGLILPSDPNALIDRFDLLFSSKKAGHTGVRNEIISILDELKRQKVINVNEYKKLNSLIKK